MTMNREQLLDVVADLNTQRAADIDVSLVDDALIAAILEVTENGANVKKLSRTTRAAVKKLVAEAPVAEAPVAEAVEDASEDAAEVATEVEPPVAENKPTRAQLNAAAHDMNEIMGLTPGIDTTLDDDAFMNVFCKAAGMAAGTDNFNEDTWAVLAALDLGPERKLPEPVKAKNQKKAKQANASQKKPAGKKEKSTEPKVGVISTIKDELEKAIAGAKGVITIDAIHAVLVQTFPERDPKGLMNTLKIQVPSRMGKEKGFKFTKLESGGYKVSK